MVKKCVNKELQIKKNKNLNIIFFTEFQKPYSNCLREVTVPIVGFEECQKMYENDPSRIKVLKGMKFKHKFKLYYRKKGKSRFVKLIFKFS